jgi:uncharacterized membrane-anchored protein
MMHGISWQDSRFPINISMNKVAQVSFYFWIMKICATTLGETAGDLLSMTLYLGYAVSSLILVGLFLLSLIAQLKSDKFHPALYWSVILTTSTAGTTMSDYMDRTIGIGYAMGSLVLASLLTIVLMVWHYSEKTISVSNIKSTKAEVFYWVAILISNTLGTAFGDYLADNSGLGFLGGATLVGGCIALTAVAARYTPVNRVILFWLAFVLTRPFGATFGDFLTKPIEQDGLGFGTIATSTILGILLIIFVIYTSYKKPAIPAH